MRKSNTSKNLGAANHDNNNTYTIVILPHNFKTVWHLDLCIRFRKDGANKLTRVNKPMLGTVKANWITVKKVFVMD